MNKGIAIAIDSLINNNMKVYGLTITNIHGEQEGMLKMTSDGCKLSIILEKGDESITMEEVPIVKLKSSPHIKQRFHDDFINLSESVNNWFSMRLSI